MESTLYEIMYKLKVLSRERKHYIDARWLVSTKLPSCINMEECGDQVMKMYCKRAGRTDGNGEFNPVQQFRLYKPSSVLLKQPKLQ